MSCLQGFAKMYLNIKHRNSTRINIDIIIGEFTENEYKTI